MTTPLLHCENLNLRFKTQHGDVYAVNGVNFEIHKGDCVGIVGESGSGKSQTVMALMGLLADNAEATGSVKFEGNEILNIPVAQLNQLRGNRISIIFQDPMTSLTPFMRIGDQLREVLREHSTMSRAEIDARVLEILEIVQIPQPRRRLKMYPHELSGGQRQRVMIAQALLCRPDLLIADEPTTALDITIQAQILDFFKSLKKRTTIMMITHDLGVVAGLCNKVMVMYGGRIVETGPIGEIFNHPQHPYTRALLAAMPRPDSDPNQLLQTIEGQPPTITTQPQGCSFAPRCPHAVARCREDLPQLRGGQQGHLRACHLDFQP